MPDLQVVPRINSDTISRAFEQNLQGEEEFSLGGKQSKGAPAARPVVHARAPAHKKPPQIQKVGYSDDPFIDSEDSWLVPSPGPPSSQKGFKLSPPKDADSILAKTAYKTSPRTAQENSKQEANKIPAGRRMTESPTKKPSKIPRVANLGGPKTPPKSDMEQIENTALGAKTLKANSSNKFVGLRKKQDQANGVAQAPAAERESAAANSKGAPSKAKGVLQSERSIDAQREDVSGSRIPSRTGTAFSTKPGSTVPSKPAIPAKRATVAPAARRGGRTGGAAASTRRNGKPGNRGTETGDSANRAVPLLTAISGPEEVLAAAVQEAEGEPQAATGQEEGPGPVDALATGQNLSGNVVNSLPPLSAPQDDSMQQGKGLAKTRSVGSVGETPRSGKTSKTPTPRPDWVDATDSQQVGTQPKEGFNDASADPTSEQAAPVKEGSVGEASFQVPKTSTEGAAVEDDKPNADQRPGVGRKKADDLPDKGYSTPSSVQKGCCGCTVM